MLIAGQVDVTEVMLELVKSRPVFHSEADFQFAFSQQVEALAPTIRCRLEVPQLQDSGRSRYVDLMCLGENASTAVEFKYFTRPWSGEVGQPRESYNLRGHAATDLARVNFVHDIRRLEHNGRT